MFIEAGPEMALPFLFRMPLAFINHNYAERAESQHLGKRYGPLNYFLATTYSQ